MPLRARMMYRHLPFCLILVMAFLPVSGKGQPFDIRVRDTVVARIESAFHGLQYHGNSYNAPEALDKLAPLRLHYIRIWAYPDRFHPRPGEWQWEELDQKIAEIREAGYTPLPCLFQSEEWYTGTADSPWWHNDSAVHEWQRAARALAGRYAGRIDKIIIFDEPNMLHQEEPYYMGFKRAAELYMLAAAQIRNAAPGIAIGGPSAFGGWENGHFANYVLNEAGGDTLLDFISSNIFLSWRAEDATATVMDRTIWYEEAGQKITAMLGERGPRPLLLDAYNFSALWKKDGELWTDPRNISYIGAVYQAAAQLHAARGGYRIALRWETLGGYGILRWYPAFEELPPYYSWRLLIDRAGLSAGARILTAVTSEAPVADAPHHSGMDVGLYRVQPFALRRKDGGISLILINKYDMPQSVRLHTPPAMSAYTLYRLDSTRLSGSLEAIAGGTADDTLALIAPPYSVTVVRYHNDVTALPRAAASRPHPSLNAAPTPFNNAITLSLTLGTGTTLSLGVYDIRGRLIRLLHRGSLPAGTRRFRWDGRSAQGRPVNSGLYFARARIDGRDYTRKIILIR